MNKEILHPAVQDFIRKNFKKDLSSLILKGSPFPEVRIQEIAAQINGLQKAEKKLPTWYEALNVIFPPNTNLEQTSSEVTGKYKASLVSGRTMIDITGGLGIDAFFFAENFEMLIHCELDQHLSEIAAHNFTILGRDNIVAYNGDGIEYLKNSTDKFDLIYLDPSRRDDYGGKVFLLGQSTPNVAENLDLLLNHSNKILVKTSPLLDLKAGLREMEGVSTIHIVSVNNEVKELLWEIEKSYLGEIQIKTINFLNRKIEKFEAVFTEYSKEAPISLPATYLYEPNPAVMKSGLFAEVASQTGTKKLHSNSHLFTSYMKKKFPGRSFKINEILPYSKKALKNFPELKKANITTRNFPKTVEEIRKDLKIADGGHEYIFFTTNLKNEKIMLWCTKI